MTAVEAPRAPGFGPGPGGPGSGGPGPGGPAAPPPPPRRRSAHLRVAALVVVLTSLVAGLATFGAFYATVGHYQSTAEIVFTNTMPSDDNIAKGSRYVQDRIGSWEGVAGSAAVGGRAAQIAARPGGTPYDPAAVTITGKHLSGTEILQVTATSGNSATVAANATAAAQATVDVVVASEEYPGTPRSKIAGTVVSPGGPVVDHGVQEARWWGVLGAVGGFIVSLLACALLRPGRWSRDLAPHTVRSRRRMVELNATVMGDELRNLLEGLRRPQGKITVGLAAVAIAGYGATGSMLFPLLPILAAAVWSWRTADPRWSAAALLFTGVGVFPEKVDVIKLGPVTPTVLEVGLVLALVMVLRGRSSGLAPRSAFAAPIAAILLAATVGAISALALGGEFSLMIDNYRAILQVATFVPVYFAFARRPHQLISVLLYIAGVCSAVVLAASVLGWSRLLVDERSSVITGSSTSDVARLSGPTLNLWAPLLVLLLSALMPRKPRWLWLGLVLIGVLHEAGSFNRSTWAPLILLIVAVAAVTHGPKGLVRRAAVLIVIGAIGFSVALTGLAGGQAKQIALRASSVVTGQAYGEDSLPDRLRENAAAYATLEKQPWLGVGVGQYYGGELITYDDEHSRTVVDPRPYIHNQYLRIWLYMGVFGLFAYAFAGVRILSLVLISWRRRTPGAPMVVVIGMGLACLAAQSSLQTMLVDRPAVITTVTLMAAASAFATWTPWPRPIAPAPRRPGVPAGGPGPDRRPGSGPVPSPPRRPAARAGTMEE
jgi:O-antigen ligase